MWTPGNQPRYGRGKLRYPGALTDEERLIIGPLIPDAKDGDDKRRIDMHAVLNGVMHILSAGCR
ncbi:hypothetical protein E2C06_18490 [Dankookia rubra]|uniref:Transposase n=1 Tax=Dankookia rubra TaxID=1442381 RepID=A0A4R5QDR2_9PROT|nr:transposase [Dankookia rubra]TDH61096.1 hypothetical protein E2C06_18490 [Dankookia rubra]